MEQWDDQGIVLSSRAHGESGAIVTLLTENHGRYLGYVRGGQSSRMRGVLEVGSVVSAKWSARTTDSLGGFVIEQESYPAAVLMQDRLKLGALLSACALCDAALPEREAHPGIFYGLTALIEIMDGVVWHAAYVIWEIALMGELGFGINLSRCAGGGDDNDLIYVSPKSGHAVSRGAGEIYKDKLLALPGFLRPEKTDVTDEDVLLGLEMTGYFLEFWVFTHHTRGVPTERLRFQERFAKHIGQLDKESKEYSTHGTG